MYLLLDANVTAGYYLPRSLNSKKAQERIEIIIDSIRSGATKNFLYIPNFCIAEVFSVFMKHSFGTWNKHVKSTIDSRVYKSLVEQFQQDIHNGKFMYHFELNRYHILGINLVAPIDHFYQIKKKVTNKRGKITKQKVVPASTFDHLIISMGINLAHIHGPDNVCIISSDDRLTRIISKCKSKISPQTVKKLKLKIAEDVTGKPFGPNIFPKYLNLKNATQSELASVLGQWPLPIGALPKVYRWTKSIK